MPLIIEQLFEHLIGHWVGMETMAAIAITGLIAFAALWFFYQAAQCGLARPLPCLFHALIGYAFLAGMILLWWPRLPWVGAALGLLVFAGYWVEQRRKKNRPQP